MGCGGSVNAGAGKPLEGAILVHSAKGLRSDTDTLSGCDPYAICRIGPASTDWTSKPSKTERRSETVRSSSNPVWRLAFTYSLPADTNPMATELHIRVFDKDLFSSDDFLGELKVILSDLLAHAEEARDYPLEISGKPGGTVNLMAGSKVEKALEDEVKSVMGLSSRLNSWQWPVRNAVNKLGQFFGSAVATPYYWANVVQMAFKWSRPVENGTDRYVEWMRERTTDLRTREDTYRWAGPEAQNCTTFNGVLRLREDLSEAE